MFSIRTLRKPNQYPDLAFLIQETEEEYYTREDTSTFQDALNYQATRSGHLQPMVEYLGLRKDDVFVDFGCGKGRIVCFVAMHDIRKVVGVELRSELADFARRRTRTIKTVAPVEIYHQDAAGFYSADGTIFYLFNPFGEETVKRVLHNIRRSVDATPRTVRIVYNNSIHSNWLDGADWLVREGHIPDTDIFVWRNRQ
jgi:precorrin-6B methylase 2